MKQFFKTLWTKIVPIIKGWTLEGMATLLEKEGYCVSRVCECKTKKRK